jgi:hypothetical protein
MTGRIHANRPALRAAFSARSTTFLVRGSLTQPSREAPIGSTIGEGLGIKQILFAAALVLTASAAQAQSCGTGSNPSTHTTSGYTRSNGTYVAPYVATNPNGTQRDNFGTRGNYDPYTGTTGTRHAIEEL